MNRAPFFIVGCGRSGTSLLRALLDRHPHVAIPLESLFIVDYLRSDRPIEKLIPLLVREPEIAEWGLSVAQSDLEGVESAAAAIDRLHRLYAKQRGKYRWGQKTPRFVRSLDLLATKFESARFIHLIRDPRAVVRSLIRSDVHHSNAYFGARRWQQDVSAGLAFESQWPGRALPLRYEQLVGDPEAALRKVAGFLDLPWIEGWWQQDRAELDEYSSFYDNIHANLDRAVTDQFVDRWRQELSPRQLVTVEALAGGLMEELGYQRSLTAQRPSTPYLLYCRAERLVGLAKQFLKYARERSDYLRFLFYRKWKLGQLKEFLWTANY